MASIKRGDTWPPLRGKAEDEDGLLDLTSAESVKLIMKSGATTVQGTIWANHGITPASGTIIAPPGDADGFNWSYTWAASATAVVGTYSTELEVTWSSATTPPQVETIPNGDNPTLDIVQDNG